MAASIYQYSSPLPFIQSFYQSKQETRDGFSLRQWASEMQLSSPVLLVEILKGKRPLKLKYAHFLALGMDLDENGKIYLQAMIQMEKAVDEEEKLYYTRLLHALRPKAQAAGNHHVFSHWLNVAILSLGRISGFELTVANIQRVLIEKLPEMEITQSIEVLVRENFLFHTPDGTLRRTTPEPLTTPNDISSLDVKSYYAQVLTKAQAAINYGVLEREFQCFSMALKRADIPKVKEVIRNAKEEIASFSSKDGEELFQFGLLGFPLARADKSVAT